MLKSERFSPLIALALWSVTRTFIVTTSTSTDTVYVPCCGPEPMPQRAKIRRVSVLFIRSNRFGVGLKTCKTVTSIAIQRPDFVHEADGGARRTSRQFEQFRRQTLTAAQSKLKQCMTQQDV